MKNRFYFLMILPLLATMILTGCDPTLENESGRKVKFTASANMTPTTKTSYGSVVEGFQIINWVGGANADVIRIYSSDTHVENADFPGNAGSTGTITDPNLVSDYWYADYKIGTVNTEGHKSVAKLQNVGENGLTWEGTSPAVFYAAYPHTTAINANSDGKLRFVPSVPGGNGDATPGVQDGNEAKVSQMPLLAMKTVPSDQPVKLDFYPAFDAFEFHLKSRTLALTVQSVELYIDDSYTGGQMFLTGSCNFDLNAVTPDGSDSYDSHYLPNSALSFTNGSKSLKINLNNAPISADTEVAFTLFTLPCTLDHLCFRVNFTYDGGTYSKMLRMTYSDKTWVSFPAGHKAVITGLAVNPDIWTFKTITLKGEALAWEVKASSTSSDKVPQASQFAVSGTGVKNVYDDLHHTAAGEPYRQHWVLASGTTAKVSFNIMSPFGGTYKITPAAGSNASDFDIAYFEEDADGNLTPTSGTGTIGKQKDGKKFTTVVTFTVTPKSTASSTSKLWFNVTATAPDNEVFNIDSETQLYDIRGYHYFVTKDPLE